MLGGNACDHRGAIQPPGYDGKKTANQPRGSLKTVLVSFHWNLEKVEGGSWYAKYEACQRHYHCLASSFPFYFFKIQSSLLFMKPYTCKRLNNCKVHKRTLEVPLFTGAYQKDFYVFFNFLLLCPQKNTPLYGQKNKKNILSLISPPIFYMHI